MEFKVITIRRQETLLFGGLNLFALFVYAFVLHQFGLPTGAFMFSSPDSQEYAEVGNWLIGSVDTSSTLIRPVLYPLVLKACLMVFGVKALWLLQTFLWQISINLTCSTIREITNNKLFTFIGAVILALNLSYIALTFHALTEVTVTFLVSVFLYYLSKNYRDFLQPKFLHNTLLLFILITLIKPVYLAAVALIMIVFFPLFYLKSHFRDKKNFISLLLVLTPLLIQVGIMKTRHNVFSISEIGSVTFRNYLFSQGFAELNRMNIKAAKDKVKNFTSSEILDYTLQHKSKFLSYYFTNLKNNIDTYSTFLIFPKQYQQLSKFMIETNHIYFLIHLILIIPTIWMLQCSFWKEKQSLVLLLGLLLPFCIIMLTSGISFWQGDRLVLPALPVWITLYLFILNKIWKKVNLLFGEALCDENFCCDTGL